ncbi:DUF4143 domain-containing protein [Saxibacter everestensis]|uniref:DUF4143 domain-containing protein n=1 Tax=Saxibacter everestensis TaxID=2909229 RepID=A0ABY8QNU5_9MICO|nr:DUF4143 domain-containing protein [Brevibacteriaceae bacterium ZFBP1038]
MRTPAREGPGTPRRHGHVEASNPDLGSSRIRATASSTTTAYSRLIDATTGRDGSQPAKTTTIAYRDPALAVRLLDLSAASLLGAAGVHMVGPLFESLVTLGVRVLGQAAEASVSHLRLRGGDREVDLLVQGVDGQVLGIEVKLAPEVTNSDVWHLKWLREQIPDRVADLIVVTTGTTAYRRPDGIAVVPLALLGP